MYDEKIFKKYDIRGRYKKDFDLDFVTSLAKAYSTYLINNTNSKEPLSATVGYDARLSSPDIKDAFITGLIASGINAVDIGLCPTPLLYYSLHVDDFAGGVMITGSHNPPEYNGFKMCIDTSAMFGDALIELNRIIKEGSYKKTDQTDPKKTDVDFSTNYLDYLKRYFIPGKKKLRIAVDAGNGSGGHLLVCALKNYGCDVIELFTEPDGSFPNHHPDPSKIENMAEIVKCVKDNGLDLGIALDGDGDRLGVVDDKGGIVAPDIYMILFAKEILKRIPDAVFIAEVKCSRVLYDEVRNSGGKIIMYKTGHSLIKSRMKETGALLAGEMSGHIFFADDYFGYDDAIYSAMRLIKILSESDESLSALTAPYMIYESTPEIRIDVDEDTKFEVMDKLTKRFFDLKKNGDSIRDIITIDGARIIFDDGWGLVRASNTEPHLVLRFEAASTDSLIKIKDYVLTEVGNLVAHHTPF